jgi:hypothetical protein
MTDIALRFETGEQGAQLAIDGEHVRASSSGAHAPGRPLVCEAQLPDRPVRFRAKSLGSRRREDGMFEVKMRAVDLRREDRERLVAALADS